VHTLDRPLVIAITIIAFAFAYATEVKATPELEQSYPWIEVQQDHKNPLTETSWPKGEKVSCRCDILAMDYELCLKSIGREDCFKKVINDPPKQRPKITTEIPLQPSTLKVFTEALPCHPVNNWLEKIQGEYNMMPFAQGRAVVRSATTGNFDRPDMLMFVNPLTKKFMMLGLWSNGYACILASGEGFQGLLDSE